MYITDIEKDTCVIMNVQDREIAKQIRKIVRDNQDVLNE